MTEQDLIDLGFEKIEIDDIFDDNDTGTYHYYIYFLSDDISLVTPCNDEINGEWFVEFNASTDLQFRSKEKLVLLMDLMKESLAYKITNSEKKPLQTRKRLSQKFAEL